MTNKQYLIGLYNRIEEATEKLDQIGFMYAPHIEDTRAFLTLAMTNLSRAIDEVSLEK